MGRTMAPVRIYWSLTRIFTPKKPFTGCEYRSAAREGRGAAGARRAGARRAEPRRRPGPRREPAAPGPGHRQQGRAASPLRALPAAYPAASPPARKQARPQRLRGTAYLGGLRRHRDAFTRRRALPPPQASAGRAAAFRPRSPRLSHGPTAPTARRPPAPAASRLSRPARPCPAASPHPHIHRAAARSPRAPAAAAPPPHLLELVVGGPGRHPQDVVELRVGHVRHGGSGRRAQAGTGRGAARARPGAGRKPPRRHAQTPPRHHAATQEEPARPLRPSAARPRPLGPLRAPDPVPARRGRGRSCQDEGGSRRSRRAREAGSG